MHCPGLVLCACPLYGKVFIMSLLYKAMNLACGYAITRALW